MNLALAKQLMEKSGVSFVQGLTAAELGAAEQRWGLRFPPDLAEFLRYALPVSAGWFDWRSPDDPAIQNALAWPREGICREIEQNAFWPDQWGSRPAGSSAALEMAQAQLTEAPRLAPLCGHRYIPAEPLETGNPVFSVYQTDIICYGANLWEYLSNEYSYYVRGPGAQLTVSKNVKRIRFWSWLADLNDGAA